MDKYIGRLLDNRYEILEVIGTGGMAVVYKARCHRLNRMVAVKILKEDNVDDEDFRRRFHAESQAVAMLSHPNIVSVYDVSTSVMADYIVMELIEGISLKEYMETKGTLNWKETLHFGIQIAKALEHAHSRGIVHRDIKPHNVMVLKNGSVKVTDFGIARMMSKGNTLTKEALGSVHYISPEQAKGGRVDTRSDIYSLGVVMYEMMAGRPPYDGESPVSVAIQHINGGAAMPSTFNPNIPGGLEQIIMHAMALEIEDRYTTTTQMLQDMDEFRKDPTILFDYNVPPIDAVIRISRPPIPMPVAPPATTAQKVAGKVEGQRPKPAPSQPQKPAPVHPQKPAPVHPQRPVASGISAEAASARRISPEARKKREEELRRQKHNRMATIAVISCSLVAVVAMVIFLITLFSGSLFNKPQNLVEVPNLVGQMYQNLEEYPQFDITKEDIYDEKYPQGMIIAQKPDAGDKVVEGTKVIATVSLGPVPKIVKMEDLTNMDETSAKKLLDSYELDLNIIVEQETSETVEVGKVIRTIPAQGKELQKTDDIVLYVSSGPEVSFSTMPDVVDKTEKMARSILESQKLKLEITTEEVYSSDIKKGNVVKTYPASGEQLQTGQEVTLYLSKGPEMQVVPNVIGMDIQTAVGVLENAGFKTPSIEYVDSEKEKDSVVSQYPSKNTEWDINETISLEISNGPKPTTAPTTEPTTAPTTEPTTAPTTEPTTPTVTKDVVIDLQGAANNEDVHVSVSRVGSGNVYSQTVTKGTSTIIIPGQTGSGTVEYSVTINWSDGWTTSVLFSS